MCVSEQDRFRSLTELCEGYPAEMLRNMENSDGSLERSSDSEDDFHSAGDSPGFHGILEPSATLLAVQLAVVCVRLHQRARTQNRFPGLPVGLPPLKKRRKIFKRKVQHSSDGMRKPSARALREGGYQQLWSESCSSSTVELASAAQPLNVGEVLTIEKESWATSDESYGYALRQKRSKQVLQKASSQEHQPEQSLLNQELEAIQDGEDLTCHSNLWQDRERTLCNSNQRTFDDAGDVDDDTLGKKFKDIMDVKNLRGRKLSDDLQPSSISSSDVYKARSYQSVFFEQEKGGPWSSGIELDKADDRSFDTERSNLHDDSEAVIFSSNGATIPNSKVGLSRELEDAPRNGGREQGQLDSLLLWPVGLAVEAIGFQVRLIVQAFSMVAMFYDWCNSFASNRVRETWQAKERATEVLNQKVAMITNVPPKVTESGSMVLKRAGWGCFAALYVCILLSMLLFPTLLLDYVFLSKIVEDPVNIKEPLHFDYTLPQPAAVVFLHPPGGKLGSHSERARPVSVSHKVHITVFLTLPESDYNRELGMFQTTGLATWRHVGNLCYKAAKKLENLCSRADGGFMVLAVGLLGAGFVDFSKIKATRCIH
ncbi:hypothetical protein GOP47_0002576 [Adiantum capillus-veneris]|uniref:Uncharacterized protein n=1 Tax=Adiantum capillus-veneris TaxID=13818 RepID=A0A9D4VC18_ADICA|nr:hypothetical protein GOP47_0002576 [Adiantum capillus-veneris]